MVAQNQVIMLRGLFVVFDIQSFITVLIGTMCKVVWMTA